MTHQIPEILAKLLRVLWVPQYRRAFLTTRVAASIEHEKILADLDLRTIVDIGANRGQFALCVRHLYPKANIYSFEPLAKPVQSWSHLFGSDPHAQLFRTAISAQSGRVIMHVSRWDASSSLLPIGRAQNENFPFTEEATQEVVQTSTLDQSLSRDSIQGPALLKLDVQGSELMALNGCSALLDLFQYVYVEASFIELYIGQALATDIMQFLLIRGFELMCVANLSSGKSNRPIQADFLFRKSGGESRIKQGLILAH